LIIRVTGRRVVLGGLVLNWLLLNRSGSRYCLTIGRLLLRVILLLGRLFHARVTTISMLGSVIRLLLHFHEFVSLRKDLDVGLRMLLRMLLRMNPVSLLVLLLHHWPLMMVHVIHHLLLLWVMLRLNIYLVPLGLFVVTSILLLNGNWLLVL